MSPKRSSAPGTSRRSLSGNALVATPARFDRTGRSVLARIEQAPAPPSAEEQGADRVAHDAGVAGDPAGCATGEQQGADDRGEETSRRMNAGPRIGAAPRGCAYSPTRQSRGLGPTDQDFERWARRPAPLVANTGASGIADRESCSRIGTGIGRGRVYKELLCQKMAAQSFFMLITVKPFLSAVSSVCSAPVV
jgi:hypothetical protein